jgi:hypothetical protein
MKTTTMVHNNFQLVLNSDVYNGEYLDTEVKILPAFGKESICVIAGNEIDSFVREFTALINKYKI